jgi:Undecaprenyl-phosphate galactose phosphotransferase WbaP
MLSLLRRQYTLVDTTEMVEVHPTTATRTYQALVSRVSPLATSLSLFAADILSVLIARSIAIVVWHQINPLVTTALDFGIWFSAMLFPIAYAGFGLYGAKGYGSVEELRRVVTGSALVSLVLTTTTFLVRDFTNYSRGLFISSFVLVAVLVPISRAILRHYCASRPWWGVPVLILGAGKTAHLVVESLRKQPHVGFKPIACLDDDPLKRGFCAGVPVAGPLSLAAEIGRSLKIHHALIAMPSLDRFVLVKVVERWAATFSHVLVIPNLFGIGTLWVTARDLGGVLGLEVRQNLLIPYNRWLKNVMDSVMGIVFGLFSLPIIGIAAVWIRMVSPGSPFYRQEREGEDGQTIRIFKLRTMYHNADQVLEQYLDQEPAAREEWQRYFKLRHDPRILPGIGHILRRTSLDEIPQIWNVLRGEMSMVGPRPFPAYHLKFFNEDFRDFRRKVTPGLTGLWQVSSRSNGDITVQESLDTYYIRNWSPWLDLHILIRTLGAVIFARGAY